METRVLEEVVVIHPEIHLWSGRKRLRREDLKKISGDQLPPSDLASLGSKRICDPKDVSVFEKIKRRVERDCQEVGIRFLGGYAIPERRFDELIGKVKQNEREFNVARQDFLQRYDQSIEGWVRSHSQWAEVIRRAVSPLSVVERQLRFDFQVFRVQPLASYEARPEETGMQRKLDSLPAKLFQEVATEAGVALEQTFKGRSEITRRALRPIRRIRDKLDGLSFLDARVAPVVEWIDETLESVPKTGPIEGKTLNDIQATVYVLADSEKLKELGASRLAQTPVDQDDDEEGDEAESVTDTVTSVASDDDDTDAQQAEVASTDEDESQVEPETQPSEPDANASAPDTPQAESTNVVPFVEREAEDSAEETEDEPQTAAVAGWFF